MRKIVYVYFKDCLVRGIHLVDYCGDIQQERLEVL